MEAAKRFWTTVDVTANDSAFGIQLDGRDVKTPAKKPLLVQSRSLADAIAAEWREQDEKIDPRAMPQTRYANSVIDGIRSNRAQVVETVSAYGGTDLLCYRAGHPQKLIERQASSWDPLLAWSKKHFDAPLWATEGVMHIQQPTKSLALLEQAVEAHDDFALAGLHDLVAISGSLVIGLAISLQHIDPEHGFDISRIDEVWQIEQWGHDEDAAAVTFRRRADFLEAARLLDLLR